MLYNQPVHVANVNDHKCQLAKLVNSLPRVLAVRTSVRPLTLPIHQYMYISITCSRQIWLQGRVTSGSNPSRYHHYKSTEQFQTHQSVESVRAKIMCSVRTLKHVTTYDIYWASSVSCAIHMQHTTYMHNSKVTHYNLIHYSRNNRYNEVHMTDKYVK